MAPESERAMKANDFKDEYEWKEPHDVTYHAPRAAYSHDELIEFAEAYAEYRYWKSIEPTLTCSEVVERLRNEAMIQDSSEGEMLDHAKAEAILHEWLDRHLMQVRHDYRTELKKASHSWRERRVQELEEALRNIVNERYTELDMMWCDYQPDTVPFDAWHDGVSAAWKQFDIVKKIAKDALANSEWREQIRKGAKHE